MFFIAIFMLLLLHGYVGWRILPSLALPGSIQAILWVLLLMLTFLPLIPLVMRFQGLENGFTDLMSWLGYTSLGFFTLTFIIIVARDLGWLALAGGSKVAVLLQDVLSDTADRTPFDPGRRRLFISAMNLGILGVTGTLTTYGFIQARRQQKIVRLSVPIKDLPEALEGLRIVQISDLHVGPTIKRNFVERVVEDANALQPDIIAFTGDMVDGSVRHLENDVEPLRQLSAPLGTYFITGNHEYYSGVNSWITKAEELGMKVLKNDHFVIEKDGARITMAGVHDLHAHQVEPSHACDPDAALAGAPSDSVKILLAHQPGSIHDAARLGVDLQLSGHTHGGQFKPFTMAVAQAHPYYKGFHNHDGTWINVNTGTGYWGPPMRIGVPSEITLLTLKRA